MGTLAIPGDALVRQWCDEMTWRGLAPRTVKLRRQILTRWCEYLDPRGLGDAAERDVVGFLAGDITPTTRSQYLSHLSTFYGWAVKAGHAEADPTEGIVRPKVPKGVPRPVERVDAVRAIECAGPRMRAWLLLAYLAGLRCVEVARLDRGDVLGDRLRLSGKGGKDRYVPLHPEVAAALAAAPPPYGLSEGRISAKIGDYLEGLGLDDTAHAFRHAFATNVYETSGYDVLTTAQLLGHESIATTQIYARVSNRAAKDAVAALTLDAVPDTVPDEMVRRFRR